QPAQKGDQYQPDEDHRRAAPCTVREKPGWSTWPPRPLRYWWRTSATGRSGSGSGPDGKPPPGAPPVPGWRRSNPAGSAPPETDRAGPRASGTASRNPRRGTTRHAAGVRAGCPPGAHPTGAGRETAWPPARFPTGWLPVQSSQWGRAPDLSGPGRAILLPAADESRRRGRWRAPAEPARAASAQCRVPDEPRFSPHRERR